MHLQLNHNDIPLGETLSIEINGGDFAVRRQGGQAGEFFCADSTTKTLYPPTKPLEETTESSGPSPEPSDGTTDLLEPALPDRLNLEFANLAIFEVGGTTKGATWLSDAEYQLVKALKIAGKTGLSLDGIEANCPMWKDNGTDERNIYEIGRRANNHLLDGNIPYEITSNVTEISIEGKILKVKYYFFGHIHT